MTDNWDTQEGVIVKGLIAGFCYADNAIAEGSFVKLGSSAANRLPVDATAAVGDSIGIAMRAASATGDIIPVSFSGIVKVMTGETLLIGDIIIGAGATGLVFHVGASTTLKLNSATQYIVGIALQAVAVPGDELLILLNPH